MDFVVKSLFIQKVFHLHFFFEPLLITEVAIISNHISEHKTAGWDVSLLSTETVNDG